MIHGGKGERRERRFPTLGLDAPFHAAVRDALFLKEATHDGKTKALVKRDCVHLRMQDDAPDASSGAVGREVAEEGGANATTPIRGYDSQAADASFVCEQHGPPSTYGLRVAVSQNMKCTKVIQVEFGRQWDALFLYEHGYTDGSYQGAFLCASDLDNP